ncbi:dienelactone hydrolase family protein [Pollutibacter soli]|uniref:dienelactone hydrolase family protein n=1 Tax=Pollutibacter soli TaxID=3034157 RepID=UPI003013934F
MNNDYHEDVRIPVENVALSGDLFIPAAAQAIIVFSHGSGSSRFSKRNQQVALYLRKRNFGTLLLDLLTPGEDSQYHNRFDITLLTARLAGATEWLKKQSISKNCAIGYFGASTGAASAIQAAAKIKNIGAIVSRGGRPDLASSQALKSVKAPVLLIVGSLDTEVLQLNRRAFEEMLCSKELAIVHGASHLFEEEGKLDEVALLATAWFEKYLNPVHVTRSL